MTGGGEWTRADGELTLRDWRGRELVPARERETAATVARVGVAAARDLIAALARGGHGVDRELSADLLERQVEAARAVCLVSAAAIHATGFLIGPGRLLTSPAVVRGAGPGHARFHHQRDAEGQPAPSVAYRLDLAAAVHLEAARGVALVPVHGEPGASWGALTVDRGSSRPRPGDRLLVIHHRGDGPKRIVADAEVGHVGDEAVQFVTSGEPAAAGAPVFDSRLRLIGVNRRAGREPHTGVLGDGYFRNEAVRWDAVLAALPAGWDS